MKNKRTLIMLLSLMMVLMIGQNAFAKNYIGGIVGYHSGNMAVLGEWRNESGLNSEVIIVGGIETDFKTIKIPAEIAWKYDFLHIIFGNRTLGTLSFGAKAAANINLSFGDTIGGSIALGVGLYGDWQINSKWKVFSDFSILELKLMPSVEPGFGFNNLTGVQYNINSSMAVKTEFGYNRFVDNHGFYFGVGLGWIL